MNKFPSWVRWGHRELLALWGMLDLEAYRVKREISVLPESKVYKESKVRRVNRVLLVHRVNEVSKDHRERLVHRVSKESKVQRETKVTQVNKVRRVLPVLPARTVKRDRTDGTVRGDFKDREVKEAQEDPKDKGVIPVQPDLLGSLGLTGSKV